MADFNRTRHSGSGMAITVSTAFNLQGCGCLLRIAFEFSSGVGQKRLIGNVRKIRGCLRLLTSCYVAPTAGPNMTLRHRRYETGLNKIYTEVDEGLYDRLHSCSGLMSAEVTGILIKLTNSGNHLFGNILGTNGCNGTYCFRAHLRPLDRYVRYISEPIAPARVSR